MKTFKDLVFGKRNSGGVRARMDFDNGFAISVIAGEHPYNIAGKLFYSCLDIQSEHA